MSLENLFSKNAEIKEKIAADPSLGGRGHEAMKRLLTADNAGGTIYSVGMPPYKHKASHFYEELACRYTAGAAFNRADRGKIRAECLSDKPEEFLIETIESLASQFQAFVFFSGSTPREIEIQAARAAKGGGAYAMAIAGEGASDLSKEVDESFIILRARAREIEARAESLRISLGMALRDLMIGKSEIFLQ